MTEHPPQKLKNDTLAEVIEKSKYRSGIDFWSRFYRSPLWLGLFLLLGFLVISSVQGDPDYRAAWEYVRGNWVETAGLYFQNECWTGDCPEDFIPRELDGIPLTIFLALSAYVLSMVIGLFIGIARSMEPKRPTYRSKPIKWVRSGVHVVIYNALTFYVEFMRGVPSLVFILLAGFFIVPAMRDVVNDGLLPALRGLLNDPNIPNWRIRSSDYTTGIFALAFIYGAYMSEIFRAGIQNIPRGQVEAARSLGMTYGQTMRFIVVPQAVRAIIPPLGNDFIAIIKDTALLMILGVNEVTQLAKKWAGSKFTYVETYLVLTFIYLAMTITGSMIVSWIERRLRVQER